MWRESFRLRILRFTRNAGRWLRRYIVCNETSQRKNDMGLVTKCAVPLFQLPLTWQKGPDGNLLKRKYIL